MAINTTMIARELRPGLAAIVGAYDSYPAQWKEMFDVYESDKASEIEVEMKFLGNAQIVPEGSPAPIDDMGERTVTTYTHQTVMLSFVITLQAMINNLYKSSFPMASRSLKRSMSNTKEILGASIFNNGFDPSYPIGDGQPLFSVNHPIDGGVVANRPVIGSDLTEGSLEQAIMNIQQFVDVAGLRAQVRPMKLFTDVTGQFTAEKLLGSGFVPDNANNAINPLNTRNYIPKGHFTNQYFTTPGNFMVTTNAPDGFKHYMRFPLTTDVYTDNATNNLSAKALEMYSFGVTDWRCAWGNGPAI